MVQWVNLGDPIKYKSSMGYSQQKTQNTWLLIYLDRLFVKSMYILSSLANLKSLFKSYWYLMILFTQHMERLGAQQALISENRTNTGRFHVTLYTTPLSQKLGRSILDVVSRQFANSVYVYIYLCILLMLLIYLFICVCEATLFVYQTTWPISLGTEKIPKKAPIGLDHVLFKTWIYLPFWRNIP